MQEQEFAAQQADALGAGIHRLFRFRRVADVGHHFDALAVGGDRRLIAGQPFRLARRLPGLMRLLRQRQIGGIRFQIQIAGIAIQHA